MNDVATLETGQSNAQATEPKDKTQEHLDLGVAEVFKSVSCYTPNYRKEVLQAALEKVTKATDPIERIAEIEQEVRRACDSLLDDKAKAVLATLGILSSMAGFTNVGDYCTDILHGGFGQKDVEQACEENPDDSNVAFLKHVFGMANSVCETESKMHPQEKSAAEETTEEPQVDEPEETEAQEQSAAEKAGYELGLKLPLQSEQPEKSTTEEIEELGPGAIIEKKVEDWLRNQPYSTKLAINVFCGYFVGDHDTEDIIDRLSDDYEAEILRMAENPDNSLSDEERFMTGVACELMVWRKNL